MEVSKRKTVDHRAFTRLNTIPWRRPTILNKDLLFMKYVVFEVPTLKQYLSANAPHMIRPAPLQTAARDPTTARK